MALGDVPSQADQRWITRLVLAHNYELPELWRLLEYYEGRQRLSYMHPELQATLDERVRQVVINWPRLVVDALEERIDLQGFRLGGQPANDTELDHVAQYNDLDAGYQQAHVTAMVMKRAYAIVGANPRPGEAKYPLVTIESPLEVHVELDPATKRVMATIKRWHDKTPDGQIRHYLASSSTPRPGRLGIANPVGYRGGAAWCHEIVQLLTGPATQRGSSLLPSSGASVARRRHPVGPRERAARRVVRRR